MTIEQLFASIYANMSCDDSSYAFVLKCQKQFEKKGVLGQSQLAALNSIHLRVTTGVDGGYVPKNAISINTHSQFLADLFSDHQDIEDSIKEWCDDRGFITSYQLARYVKEAKRDK
jgi:hypothetical protein